jgi:hypothetical protein
MPNGVIRQHEEVLPAPSLIVNCYCSCVCCFLAVCFAVCVLYDTPIISLCVAIHCADAGHSDSSAALVYIVCGNYDHGS